MHYLGGPPEARSYDECRDAHHRSIAGEGRAPQQVTASPLARRPVSLARTGLMKLVECVPNFSEGRRPDVVAAIRDAIAAVEGVLLLDVSSDASHNRTVVTFAAPLERAVDAAFAGVREASARIDLTLHRGEHPRMGATDVVPFIPLEGATMDDCIVLARTLGERVARELEIPVYLYERAATRPSRENLADIRRGSSKASAMRSRRMPSVRQTSAPRASTRRPARSPSVPAPSSSRTTSTSAMRGTWVRRRRWRRPYAARRVDCAT